MLPPPFDLLPPLIAGLGPTLGLTAGAAVLAVLAAVTAGLARLYGPPPLAALARVYIEVFRGTSALVQLYWVYFALPLIGLRLEAFAAGVLVLGLNTGAYGAEVVRGAIQAVGKDQWEGARALGLTHGQTLREIVLPQAFVAMLPPAGNLLVELLKATALVSLITIADLTFRAQTLRATTLRSGEIFGWVLLLYFAVAMVLTRLLARLERSWRRGWHLGGA